jgi:Uri superfamily endonuclease
MISNNPLAHIHPITPYQNGGTYVLQMTLNQPITLSFGRFQNAQQYSLLPSQYLYIGSALTQANRPALLQRTARHASRTNPDHPHSARAYLAQYAQSILIPEKKILLKQNKKLHWHIDHFLDRSEVDLTDIFLVPHTNTYESILATHLEKHPHIVTPIPGLGASDTTHETHFLQLTPQFPVHQLQTIIAQIVEQA